jgi:cysteine desulfurase
MAYFDNNATTPIGKKALECYIESSGTDWYNPSSPFRTASKVRAKLEILREEFASFFSLNPEQVIFTSGATESNNAVFANCSNIQGAQSVCLISPFEHPSITESAIRWFGENILYLPTDGGGKVLLDGVESILEQEKITLVSLIAANNETGILQPWYELSKLCSERGIFFHTDATQWIGKLDIEKLSSCTSFSGSGHKFFGPKGVGWLATTSPINLFCGGKQEFGYRGGTENYPAILSMFTAFKNVQTEISDAHKREIWRDDFEKWILSEIPGARILGVNSERLWNTSMIILPKFDNLRWVGKLDKLGFQVSTGSACSVGNHSDRKSIMKAYGLDNQEINRLVRISSYLNHSQSDWDNLKFAIHTVYEELQSDSIGSTIVSV